MKKSLLYIPCILSSLFLAGCNSSQQVQQNTEDKKIQITVDEQKDEGKVVQNTLKMADGKTFDTTFNTFNDPGIYNSKLQTSESGLTYFIYKISDKEFDLFVKVPDKDNKWYVVIADSEETLKPYIEEIVNHISFN